MKLFTIAVPLAIIAATAEARTCVCTGTGFHLNVSRRACSEGSTLGWRWDSFKGHCWDITPSETTKFRDHCKKKGASGYSCY
ncbi:hypothetical protein H4219_000395 [Mycoemilia scoparia]|uniref:Uncharacterized protein n=1 Tax=Mycoemilia scoparia TaxID=417184 RepID=A0A9W8A5R3_9FUNG|nr:hypothetical protein H4219_000395 [Mycoemilia scoparia]